jgi:hypothetical protein
MIFCATRAQLCFILMVLWTAISLFWHVKHCAHELHAAASGSCKLTQNHLQENLEE